MLQVIKRYISARIKFFLNRWSQNFFDFYSIKCYSQEGEDMVLSRIFNDKSKGFYVDVGAHHPIRFSNTYRFVKSNDWKKYRPSWVLVEQLNLENIENLDFEMHHYMKSIDYVLFAKTFNTLFYKEASI